MDKVKVVNKSQHVLPRYATEGAAGLDLRANNQDVIFVKPLERVLVPTGLYMEIPVGMKGSIRPRSGLSLTKGITAIEGTIDSDYRGEVGIIIANLSDAPYAIYPGERLAQIIFGDIKQIKWESVDELSKTDRGEGGFGHTGK